MVFTDILIYGIDAVFVPLIISFIGKPAKNNKLRYTLLSLIYFISLIVLTLLFPDYRNSKYESYISIIIVVVSYIIIFKAEFFNASFSFMFGFLIIAVFEVLLLVLFTYIGIGLDSLVASPVKLIIFESIKLVFVVLLSMSNFFRKYLSKIQNLFPYIMSSIFNIFIVVQLMRTITDSLVNGKSIHYIYIYILFIAMFIINILLIRLVIKSEKERAQIKSYNEYEKMIIPLIENSRAIEHDFKNHLLTLKAMAYEKDNDEINDYIKSINKEIKENSVYKLCNNPVMGALLQEKSNYAKNSNIDFNINIYENENVSQCVEPHHMITILSNLIDNAFEEVSKQSVTDKKVSVDYRHDKSIQISVKNALSKGSSIDLSTLGKEQRFSTKGSSRGYGVSNIKRIVKEYNGEMQIYYSSDEIQIKVLLNP